MNDEQRELMGIEAHSEHIKNMIKWNISDLDHFINLLRHRISAEEQYQQSLMRIMTLAHEPENETFDQFRHVDTSVKRATDEFRDSADRQAQCRREFVQVMKNQLNVMIDLRENQERNRKFVKNALKDSNATYIGFRTKEIPKLRKAYEQKCIELENAQRMSLQEAQQPPPASLAVPPPLVQQHSSSSMASAPGSQLLLQQPYRYPMDGSIEDLPSSQRRSEDTDESSLSSLDANSPQPQKRMAGLMAKMAHMGTQLANAAAAASAPDVSKQNVKNAKTKKDIVDTDAEYRDGIRYLEHLRKKQTDATSSSLKVLQRMLKEKADKVKVALDVILKVENKGLQQSEIFVQQATKTAEHIIGDKDIEQFRNEFKREEFAVSTPIYYHNYYSGESKDLLFGISLLEYAHAHRRTVPLLVIQCVEAVERMGGLKREGIYRISGRQSNIEKLRQAFEKDEEATVLNESTYDVFTIANVMKQFLRELDTPLFPLSMDDRIYHSNIKDTRLRIFNLYKHILNLQKVHYDTLKVLIEHLSRVAANADTNKMNIQNLSLIFTPAIFHDHNQAQNPGEWFADCVLEDLIVNYEKLFSTVDPAALNNTVAVEDQRRLMEHEKARKFATAPARGYGKESSLGTMQGSPSLPSSGKTQPPPPQPSNQPPLLPTIPKNSPFMENTTLRTADTQGESNRFAEAIATANALHSQRSSPVPTMTHLGSGESKTPPTRPTIHTKLSSSSLSSPQPLQFKPLPAAASPVRTSSRASLMQLPPQQLQQVRSAPSTPAAAFEYEPKRAGPSDTLNDSYHSPLGSWLDDEVDEPKEESKERRISFNAIKRTMSLRKSSVLKSSEPSTVKRLDSLPMDDDE
ncbi:hypothetical protein INT44_006495 [Umbelopsis vinacea]|uniref:Rho-GAP domain-containing protein n=1 Tax=Umbelopsis vinacea TaxID=44442 RepID=A0A8H7UFF0_9FUNG|nr:hypothetical protein INT44_006495 [Umbelopsis vinacea]